jgi:hypothetical protein
LLQLVDVEQKIRAVQEAARVEVSSSLKTSGSCAKFRGSALCCSLRKDVGGGRAGDKDRAG